MTNSTHSMLDVMQQLEQALLHADHRANPAKLEQLLAPDFQEVSPRGTVSSREDVMQWLLQKDPAHRWQWQDWQVQELAPQVCLVRYHAQQCVPASPSKGSLHSSLWRYDQTLQCWRLAFHQSTKVVQ
jgi:hypothetical protein